MELKKQKDGSMFLHQEIGKGNLPDGRDCRLIQTNQGIHMQVYPKRDKNNWKTYTLSFMELSKCMVDEIIRMEKAETQTTDSKKKS